MECRKASTSVVEVEKNKANASRKSIYVTVRVNPHVLIKRFGGKTGGRLGNP